MGMGYDVRIVRDGDARIPIGEWVAYVESDPDLHFAEEGKPYYTPHLALLPRGPEDPEGWPWLWWSGGNISAKYPQEPTLKKMIQVAAHFGATVVGDEGESYRLDDEGKIAVEGF